MFARAAVAAVLAALIALPSAGAAPPAPAGDSVVAAAAAKKGKKKKCKKGQVRKGKRCVRRTAPAPAPIADLPVPAPAPPGPVPPPGPTVPAVGSPEAQAAFTQLLAGSVFTLVYANTGASGSSQGNDRLWFCADGTLRFHGEYIGYTGNAYVTQWSGTWRVEKAGFTPDGQGAEGLIAYTADTTEIPPQGQAIVQLLGNQSSVAGLGNQNVLTYEWARGAAGC